MDRQTLITVTAAALFAAFLLGWLACWLVQRLTGTAAREDCAVLARRLQAAEDGRAAAAAEAQAALDALRDSRTEIEELRDYIEKRLARGRTQP